MGLYSDFETETSYEYLQKIVGVLNEPLCILGGWAVYFTVNTTFRKDQGRNYLGSRDIDLGFYLNNKYTKQQLKSSTIGNALSVLEKQGFKPLGFRYYKDIHIDTGNELTSEQSAKTPTHDIFQIYIDPVVNEVHPLFKEVFRFDPVDEPLLTPVFKDKNYRTELMEFHKRLWLPTPEILLATKLKSICNRTKDEKLIKDMCDIYALSWYSSKKFHQLKHDVHKLIEGLEEISAKVQSEELFKKTETALGIEAKTIKNVFIQLLKP
jgi:hypothetical protein